MEPWHGSGHHVVKATGSMATNVGAARLSGARIIVNNVVTIVSRTLTLEEGRIVTALDSRSMGYMVCGLIRELKARMVELWSSD